MGRAIVRNSYFKDTKLFFKQSQCSKMNPIMFRIILIIDDDVWFRRITSLMIHKSTYTIPIPSNEALMACMFTLL